MKNYILSYRLSFYLLILTGCSGSIIVNDARKCPEQITCANDEVCLDDGTCKKITNECSPSNHQGFCPDNQDCVRGSCLSDMSKCCADCNETQGCLDCKCIAITNENKCSPKNQQGTCAKGKVCVSGTCVEVRCSASEPGCCPSGTACFEGACRAIAERPCKDFPKDGLCPAGQDCLSGNCVTATCDSDNWCGSCEEDFACEFGDCHLLPCGPDHLKGSCESGKYCSVCGECLPYGDCCDKGDCAKGKKCSVTKTCIPEDKCLNDNDCDSESEYCCKSNKCTAKNACCDYRDCPPGHNCTGDQCVLRANAECNSNNFVINDGNIPNCSASKLLCCQENKTCCPQGEKCNLAKEVCIKTDACLDDNDCLTTNGFYCDQTTWQCAPKNSSSNECTGACNGGCQGTCPPGYICSDAGACIPTGYCVNSIDCASGQACTSDGTCQLDCTCGCVDGANHLISNNLLMLLDRSTSMSEMVQTKTRWDHAKNAIGALLDSYKDLIRFGLGTFPERCDSNLNPGNGFCGDFCDNYTCDTGDHYNCTPGGVNVSVDENKSDSIKNYLDSDCPGGFTPTAETLNNIADNIVNVGIGNADNTNSIVLVTDGNANCHPQCGTNVDNAATYVYNALDKLRDLEPSIRTYIIGFGVRSEKLNCYAVHGGTSLCSDDDDVCSARSLNEKTCENGGCMWDGANCVGNAAFCATMDNDSSACKGTNCTWQNNTGKCLPDDSGCDAFKEQLTCEARCAWINGASTCSGYDSQCAKEKEPDKCALDCSWTSVCDGDVGCDAVPMNSCLATTCIWNDISKKCEGDDTACMQKTSDTCSSSGCTWHAKCVDAGNDGEEALCNAEGNYGRCISKCIYDVAHNKCVGDFDGCYNKYFDQGSCRNNGCYWATEGFCTADNTTCAAYDNKPEACNATCGWDGYCTGNNSLCGSRTQAQCQLNCYSKGVCTGSDSKCSNIIDYNQCIAKCVWQDGVCTGDDVYCQPLSYSNCLSSGCYWYRSKTCVGVNAQTCTQAGTCYYLADEEESLKKAFDEIASELAYCTFVIKPPPQDDSRIQAFLKYNDGEVLPGNCQGKNPCPIVRSASTWTYDRLTSTLAFRDTICDTISNKKAVPYISLGCADAE
ncbi:MAG: hypothetical protein JW841_11330 [Deltaproteobacteria bacterium]|nr:hypothetical protein [Deltaproteobacteria bacterium]